MEDKTLRMSMLLDFFGELLTEKQREYFDLHYNEDLSVSEIAERAGITRQGVFDMVLRAERSLEDMELKTGVVKRFDEMRKGLETAETLACELMSLSTGEGAEMAQKLLEVLRALAKTVEVQHGI